MIKLELTEQEVNVIGQALGQMPYAAVAQLINKLIEQVKQQENDNDTLGNN